jgi:hypothetical protein
MPKTAGVRALELPDQRGGLGGDQGGTVGDGRETGVLGRRAILDGCGWVRKTKPSSEQAALFLRAAWP